MSAAAAASFAVYSFNVHPQSVQRSSKGVLPAVVLGATGLAAQDIDPSSLALEGVAPLRWDLVDDDGDGVVDLTLKFDRQAIVTAIDAKLAAHVLAAGAPGQQDVGIVRSLSPEAVARALLDGGETLSPA